MTPTKPPVYLSDPKYTLGVPVRDLSRTDLTTDDRETFLATGNRGFRAFTSRKFPAILKEAVTGYLEDHVAAGIEIDRILVSTGSFDFFADYDSLFFAEIFAGTCAQNVKVDLLTYKSCANYAAVLQVAAGQIQAGFASNVLLVFWDRALDEKRAIMNGQVLLGDGIAIQLASKIPVLPYRYKQAVCCLDHSGVKYLVRGPAEELARYTAFWFLLIKRAYRGLNLTAPPDFFLMNNYTRDAKSTVMSFLALAGTAASTDHDCDRGHVSSTDSLIELARLTRSTALRTGHRIVVLGTGLLDTSAVLLEMA